MILPCSTGCVSLHVVHSTTIEVYVCALFLYTFIYVSVKLVSFSYNLFRLSNTITFSCYIFMVMIVRIVRFLHVYYEDTSGSKTVFNMDNFC